MIHFGPAQLVLEASEQTCICSSASPLSVLVRASKKCRRNPTLGSSEQLAPPVLLESSSYRHSTGHGGTANWCRRSTTRARRRQPAGIAHHRGPLTAAANSSFAGEVEAPAGRSYESARTATRHHTPLRSDPSVHPAHRLLEPSRAKILK